MNQHKGGHVDDGSVHTPRDDAVYLPIDAASSSSRDHAVVSASPMNEESSSRVAVRKLVLVTVIALVFMLMEFIGGYIAGSLAVISDAVHMLTDVLGFAIALTAIWIGKRPPSDRLSFGFHRVEVVGALVSILVIWVLTGVLVYSAVLRCQEFLEENAEEVVDGRTMFIVALIGLLINVVMMRVLGSDGHGHSHGIGGHSGHGHAHGHGHGHGTEEHVHAGHDHDENHEQGHSHSHGHGSCHGSHDDSDRIEPEQSTVEDEPKTTKMRGLFASKFENLNIQAAYLHVLGDLLQSVGVTIAGAVIWWRPSWQLADPIMTFVFSLLVVATTFTTAKESLLILMEATPRQYQYTTVEHGLKSCRDVLAVHDLHIWSLSTNKPALAVHLVSAHPETSLVSAQQYLIGEGITHSTIQVERPATAYPQQCTDHGRCT